MVGLRLRIGLVSAMTSSSALAQFGETQVLREGAAINAHEIYPARPLTLEPETLGLFLGVNMNLTHRSYFEPVTIPIGASYGVIENLEVGADLFLALNRPDPLSFFAVSEIRLFGRYAFLPQILAAELTAFIPVGKDGDRFALRLDVPFRFAFTPDFLVMANGSFATYFGSKLYSFAWIGELAGVFIYRPIEKFWAAVELGVRFTNSDFLAGAATSVDVQVPLGLALGYEILDGIAVLPGFRFPDVREPSLRVFQLLVVYLWDFLDTFRGKDEETPEIPLQPAPEGREGPGSLLWPRSD
jgi:hypothetical protein